MSVFSRWYRARDKSLDIYKQSFEAREDAHVLRVAALLCINDGSWQVSDRHIDTAIELVAEIKTSGGSIFEGAEVRTKFAAALDSLRSTLISAGMDPIARHALARKCRRGLDINEFNALLDVLHEAGAVQRFSNTPERGRPTEYFRGTNILLTRGLGEQILEKFV
jgi:hypothetical protein